MTRKITTTFAAFAIAALSLAGLVSAQSGETKKDGAMAMMHDCPMMRGTAEGPAAALKQRAALGLTEAQVQRLEAIEHRTRNETLAVLTPEQRGKLAQAGAGMMGMMRQDSSMMDMSQCPMMQGMMGNGMEGMRMHGDSGSRRNRPQN